METRDGSASLSCGCWRRLEQLWVEWRVIVWALPQRHRVSVEQLLLVVSVGAVEDSGRGERSLTPGPSAAALPPVPALPGWAFLSRQCVNTL